MKPMRPGELGILKLVFGLEKDGRFGIKHLLPIPLRPADGEPNDLFKISDDLLLAQPAYLSTIVATLRQSIVPIVATVSGESTLRCLGTGFFVSATGLLVTAAHVVTDPILRNYGGVRAHEHGWSCAELGLGVMMNVGPYAWTFRTIEWAQFLSDPSIHPLPIRGHDLRLTSDTAICQVSGTMGEIFQPLTIIQSGLRGTGFAIDKTATAIGFGAMQDTGLKLQRPNQVIGDFNFDLYVATGKILEHMADNPINRRSLTPGPVVRTSLKLPAGMSGSPIFDDEGIYVHAVASSSLEDEGGLTDHGIASMLAPSLHVPITHHEEKTLLELVKSGSLGMPKLSLPDG